MAYDNLHPTGCSEDEIEYLAVPPITVAAGNTQQLLTAGQVEAQAATWTSDAPGVATVSASGLVTAVAPGTANMRAISGAYTANVIVTVTA